jgi:uncharacterized membrane protein YfcA
MIFEDYFYIIWLAAFVTAIVSATIGMIGGTLLLSVLAQFLKMEVLIPLHGLVQLSSNASRAWFLRDSINRKIAIDCIIGVVIGSVVGSFYVVRVHDADYNIILGLFILAITLAPKFKMPVSFKSRWIVLGFVASFLGLFFGAIGILVGSVFLAEKLDKKAMISTQAVCQSAVHLAKVLVFSFLGFSLAPWLYLLLGTLVMTFAGSWVGTKILDRIPEATFRKIFTFVIIVLSLRLVWTGFSDVITSK